MSFRMLSDHHLSSHEIIPASSLYPSSPPDETVTKYLESLRARLEFARFKMKQGWEGSTLPDVEMLWRQRQERSLNDLPKPRFTQRDIIDKRAYIPSLKQSKVKKSKSMRSSSISSHIPTSKPKDKEIYFHHYNLNNTLSDPNSPHSDDTADEFHLPAVRNSLDYLSYAIAMTEADHKYHTNDTVEDMIEDNGDSQLTKSSTDTISPPSSPVTTAAKAIMMFGSRQGYKPIFP